MKKLELEVYSEASNHAIVRMEGRRFPGCVVQGDSLSVLCSEARQLALALQALQVRDEDLLILAREHQEKLLGRLLHYQQVLVAHGIELPYGSAHKESDLVQLLPDEPDADEAGQGMNRSTRQQLAQHTLELLDAGRYTLPDGRLVDFSAALERCLQGTRLYSPEALEVLAAGLRDSHPEAAPAAVELVNQTTLEAIADLLALQSGPVLALNFASAKNPGGGFKGGSQAQEESLARSSGLYPSLDRSWAFYERHRAMASALYTDAAILTPQCPIFRDDVGNLFEQVRLASFVSCAAPNAGAIADHCPEELPRIPEVLRQRCEKVLALAAAQGVPNLVLGAWGSGVFRNDPAMVADAFASLLEQGWNRRFVRVRFAVLDGTADQATFEAFRKRLAMPR